MRIKGKRKYSEVPDQVHLSGRRGPEFTLQWASPKRKEVKLIIHSTEARDQRRKRWSYSEVIIEMSMEDTRRLRAVLINMAEVKSYRPSSHPRTRTRL